MAVFNRASRDEAAKKMSEMVVYARGRSMTDDEQMEFDSLAYQVEKFDGAFAGGSAPVAPTEGSPPPAPPPRPPLSSDESAHLDHMLGASASASAESMRREIARMPSEPDAGMLANDMRSRMDTRAGWDGTVDQVNRDRGLGASAGRTSMDRELRRQGIAPR